MAKSAKLIQQQLEKELKEVADSEMWQAGKVVRGEMRAGGQAVVNATLRRQGILVTKVRKQRVGRGGRVSEKDLALFTRLKPL